MTLEEEGYISIDLLGAHPLALHAQLLKIS
jgi:hypothetical protein